MPADLKLTAYTYDDTIGPMWWIEISDVEPWPTREEAEAAIARYHAAVVESSPEVAALRRERDELSEMVEELKAENNNLAATNEELRRWIAQAQEDRHAVDRALKDATDAAGATSMHGQGRTLEPKVRDESVPPPGWWREDDYDGMVYIHRLNSGRGLTLSEAWRIYDAEHGYAPDRITELEAEIAAIKATFATPEESRRMFEDGEARTRADERERIAAAIEDAHQPGTYPHKMAQAIRANATPAGHSLDAGWHERAVASARADERARTEADIAAASREYAEQARAAAKSWEPSSTAEAKFHRGRARGADDLAQRVNASDYPKLPR